MIFVTKALAQESVPTGVPRACPWGCIEKGANPTSANPLEFKSAGSRNRTTDTRIFSPLLYRLS
jgi:hypothetical protein